ncbi:MAG: AIR synthase-related protein, partial [Chloroflexota bacterium]|nr:AIR synthase-related protein [Chloroflexota bacterium]
VSLYNETKQSPIHPTPMVGCVGKLDNVGYALGMAWQNEDDVFLIGDGRPVLGGSDYLATIHGRIAGLLPEIDFEMERNVQQCVRKLAGLELCHAAHDVSGGGLATALAEMAIAAGIGAVVEPLGQRDRLDAAWFGESGGRILVTAPRQRRQKIADVVDEQGVPLHVLGSVGGVDLALGSHGSIAVEDLRAASEQALSLIADHGRLEIDGPVALSHVSRWG